jgi:hypothetical protein
MSYLDVEKFLTELKSVSSCRIICDDNKNIEEIHVLANNGRSSKQISRDIQSTLLSKYNIDVDYKKISIAQVDEELRFEKDYRLKLNSINYETIGDSIKIRVSLGLDGKSHMGEYEGIKTERNSLKIGARALLNAVEDITKKYNTFLIESIEIKSFAGREIVLAAVSVIEEGREDILCGSAFVNFSKVDATIKACLSAVNRRALKNIQF